MTDSSSTPLTEQTLRRLRALAQGNGIEPESILLMNTDEQTYKLEGTLTLTPFCDAETTQYPGPPKGANITTLENVDALHQDIARQKSEFQGRTDWIGEVHEELHKAPGQGWGLDGAKIMLIKRAAELAASSPCAQCQGSATIPCGQCQGQGFIVCIQCHGQRQEPCATCAGSGLNPQNRNEQCPVCRGIRMIPCRLCRATGQMTCPTCGGKRGTPCPACSGAGQITEHASLTFGASVHFQLNAGTVPSGLRRGLDRLGVANLSKGHADIEIVQPKAEADEASSADADHPPEAKPPQPMLHYIAQLPFADMRIDFDGRKAAIGAFGKRGIPVDVPPFLDEPLKPWREKLKAAAQGNAPIEEAIKARALRDALGLEFQGKGNVKEFRRFYPVGISSAVANEMIQDIRNAIKRITLIARVGAAVFCSLLSAGFFAGCYFTSLPLQLMLAPKWQNYAFDFAPPVVAAGVGWTALYAATRFILRRRFPDMPVALKLPIGKTGMVMIAVIFIAWIVILALSPARPGWLSFIH